MRIVVLALALSVGCGPTTRNDIKPTPAASDGKRAPTGNGCTLHTRAISPPGHAGVRPQLTASDGVFAIVWEDSDDNHRGVQFQSLDPQAKPAGPSVEVANLDRGGAEPQVVADGDGFAVLWTADQADASVIVLRRVDARGKPRGDVVPAVTAPNARALASVKVADGFAVAWWSWSSSPPEQTLSWLDATGKPKGKPVSLTKGSLVEPQVDLEPSGDGVSAVWVEQVQNADHVVSGEVTRTAVQKRVDLGPGSAPSLITTGVLYANLADGSVWRSPRDLARPVQLTEGQSPDAVDDQVCLFRTISTTDLTTDELRCLSLKGDRVTRDQRVAGAPGGVLTLKVASLPGVLGVVYQTEEDDRMTVQFAALSCPDMIKR